MSYTKIVNQLFKLSFTAAVLSGCQLQITSTEGGAVHHGSESGSLCQPSCSLEISEAAADMYFAIAEPGYEFDGWSGRTSLCTEESGNVCTIEQLGPFGIPTIDDAKINLVAIFKKSLTVEPSASFTNAPNRGTAPLTVSFSDSSEAGTQEITNWLWEFGDGTISNARNPRHTYNTAGSYDVSLTVTNAEGSDTKLSTGSVVVAAALPSVIIENALGLPAPTKITDVLPDFSEEVLVKTIALPEFNPIVNQLNIISWNGTLGVGDCRFGAGRNELPLPTSASSLFTTAIPQRSSGDFVSDIYAGSFYGNPVVFPTFPGRLLMVGKYNNPNNPQSDGRSFNLTGPASGKARWESCEERTPFLQDSFTSYILSYPQRIKEMPVLRHYKAYKKIRTVIVSGDGTQTGTQINKFGISETEASSFTASITATVSSSAPATGGIEASISATLSSTLSSSVTVFSEDTDVETFTADSSLKPGYSLHYTVWVEVDIFRIEGNTQGVVWSDPNYRLAPNQLEIVSISRDFYESTSIWFLRQ